MKWSRSDTLALAQHNCVLCWGVGLRPNETSLRSEPCYCVLREIFRACLRRFRSATSSYSISRATLGQNEGPKHLAGWGRKNEEFAADFDLVAHRTLSARHYEIFKLHFLLGGDYRVCCARLNMDRGTFFHEVYRVQAALGRACAETEPYPLFPVDEYFTSSRLDLGRADLPLSASPARSRAAVLGVASRARPSLSFRYSEAQAA